MRSSEPFNHFVDEFELREPFRRQAQCFGRGFFLVSAFPQDRGAALGRNHGVDAVLEHQQTITNSDCQRTPRAALPNHDTDDWNLKRTHREEIACDRLTLAALF